MKIKKIILEKWIDPALITHHLTKKFGDKGLAWLDSDGKENGEWSIIGIKPKKIIQSRDINNLDKTNNPFNNLRNIEKGFWIGWLSYEAGVYIEPKNPWKKSNMATLWIASYDPIIKCNLIKKEIIIEGTNSSELMNYKNIINNIKNIEEENIIKTKLNFDFSKINLDEMAEKFQKNILKLKKLISLGDIFQANLTTKCEIESSKNYNPLDIYLKIRRKLRAPFGGIIINNNYKEAVLSTSPERFLKIDNKNFVESRPIKGTRSRDKDLNQDALNAIDLITNEKDRAENIMIVDLIRNDLSKVCETGSIMVPEILKLESFLKVHHLTSVIRGKLKKDRLFELEECERGPYCGSFLKLDWNGEFDSNILIRSFLIKDKKINIYAGCGIVIDSNPEEETNELKWKLLPLIDSLK